MNMNYLCSQKPTSGFCSKPRESSLHPLTHIHFHIILTHTYAHSTPLVSFLQFFKPKSSTHLSFPHVCYMSSMSHLPCFNYYYNYISLKIQIMKFIPKCSVFQKRNTQDKIMLNVYTAPIHKH
jgi:hypothetical protein